MRTDGAHAVEGRSLQIATRPTEADVYSLDAAPVLYWPMSSEHGDSAADLARRIADKTSRPFTLVACCTDAWERDLSPWPSSDPNARGDFSGEGPAFLDWIRDACIPFVEEQTGGGQAKSPVWRIIGGYSLAGLFSAWSFLKTDLFCGLASCSGSLWYPGWAEWRQSQLPPRNSVAYISLGRKEPRTKNPLVAQVGNLTEQFADQLATEGRILESTFVWNPGGHFNDPAERMAEGFAWAVDCLARNLS